MRRPGTKADSRSAFFLFLCLDALEQPHLGHFPVAADGLFVHPEQGGYFGVVQWPQPRCGWQCWWDGDPG